MKIAQNWATIWEIFEMPPLFATFAQTIWSHCVHGLSVSLIVALADALFVLGFVIWIFNNKHWRIPPFCAKLRGTNLNILRRSRVQLNRQVGSRIGIAPSSQCHMWYLPISFSTSKSLYLSMFLSRYPSLYLRLYTFLCFFLSTLF